MASPEQISESNIKGVSVRAIVVLFLIFVFAVATFMKINNEALNSVVMAVIGWYFGQKGNGGSGKPSEPEPTPVPQPVYQPPMPSYQPPVYPAQPVYPVSPTQPETPQQ